MLVFFACFIMTVPARMPLKNRLQKACYWFEFSRGSGAHFRTCSQYFDLWFIYKQRVEYRVAGGKQRL